MSRRESTRVPSKSHKIVVMVMVSPRATFLPSREPIALWCANDYTAAIAVSRMLRDAANGKAYSRNQVTHAQRHILSHVQWAL
jgi:hypothetical protein